MKPARRGFEWTFSSRTREHKCSSCPARTSAYLTNLRTGVRRPLCSRCFLKSNGTSAAERKQPASVPNPQPQEQLRLC
jgi:hypothetical protein